MPTNKTTYWRQLRLASNLTTERFAAHFGVSLAVMGRWERAEAKPLMEPHYVKKIELVLSTLGLSIADLPDYWDGRIEKLEKNQKETDEEEKEE